MASLTRRVIASLEINKHSDYGRRSAARWRGGGGGRARWRGGGGGRARWRGGGASGGSHQKRR